MKTLTCSLRRLGAALAAAVLAVCLSLPAMASAPLVRDDYGLFDGDTLSELEAGAEEAADGHDCDVYFLTVDSIGDEDQRAYAKNYYRDNDLGSGSDRSGILFMIALGSRKYVTITYGGGVTAFTDYRIEQIEDEVVPMLSDGDYADAAQTYIDLCADTLDFYAENGEPLDYDNDPDDLRKIFLTTEQNLKILVQTATTIETSVDHNSFPVIIFTQNIGIHGTETWIVHTGNMHVAQTSSR